MTTARHIVGLLKSHISGDEDHFLTIAMQMAAHEARQGHGKVAQELRELVDHAKRKKSAVKVVGSGPVPLAQPKGDLANLLTVRYSEVRLSSVVLPDETEARLRRTLLEQTQQNNLRVHGLVPRRKILLIGQPGSGKTMTAAALAGELHLPLFTIVLDGLISKFMGDTAGKLRLVFEAMKNTRGVYLFDEFDAIGSRRSSQNDVGEIRRVLNSFLQFLEQDDSESLVVAATNHPELLDPALFRRFDDVIEYGLPDENLLDRLLRARLAPFNTPNVAWRKAVTAAAGLSYAEAGRAADEAAKSAILNGGLKITTASLIAAIRERQESQQQV
ncbi:MAG: ATP-binding protein [Rhodospirillales bacterium]|nr:ATP-binding protein [Rhodospirillales bacterium]